MQGEAWVPGLREGHEVVYAVLPHVPFLRAHAVRSRFAMSIGARLVLFPKFDENLVLGAMKHIPADVPAGGAADLSSGSPRRRPTRKISLQGIRFAISGAMSLPVETVKAWETRDRRPARRGLRDDRDLADRRWPTRSVPPGGPARWGCRCPSTEIRVVDPADPSVDRGVGEEGELLVRGPQVFQGYWNRPIETADTLLDGGWLRTGDIVAVAADGFITIVDRLKEIIITGGFNVAPSEVEDALRSHPDVAGRRGGRPARRAAARMSWPPSCRRRAPRSTRRGCATYCRSRPHRLQGAASGSCRWTSCRTRSSARCCAARCARHSAPPDAVNG